VGRNTCRIPRIRPIDVVSVRWRVTDRSNVSIRQRRLILVEAHGTVSTRRVTGPGSFSSPTDRRHFKVQRRDTTLSWLNVSVLLFGSFGLQASLGHFFELVHRQTMRQFAATGCRNMLVRLVRIVSGLAHLQGLQTTEKGMRISILFPILLETCQAKTDPLTA
jgi:hypothetical protein